MSDGAKQLADLLKQLQEAGADAKVVSRGDTEPKEEPVQAYGFTYNVGVGANFRLGYSIRGNEVALSVVQQAGANPAQLWLHFSTPRSQALSQAERMVEEVKRYAAELSPLVRPTEALSTDDFLEHLRLRLEGRFH